jgi:hypothetical protein
MSACGWRVRAIAEAPRSASLHMYVTMLHLARSCDQSSEPQNWTCDSAELGAIPKVAR